jgi:amino acid transporter
VARIDREGANDVGGRIAPADLAMQTLGRMAPGFGLAASMVAAASFVGGALPLAVLVGLGWAVATSVAIGWLARQMPSPGGFAAWTAKALHPIVGFAVGWAYVLGETLAVALFAVAFAHWTSESLRSELGWPGFATALGALAVVGSALLLLGRVRLRARIRWGALLAVASMATFAVLAIGLLVKARSLPLRPFTPAAALSPGHDGWPGVLAGAALSAVAFIGLTGWVPLADGTPDGGRERSRAALAAVALVGVWAVLVTYAFVAYSGVATFAGFPQVGSGHPVEFVAGTLLRGGRAVAAVAVASSAVAGAAAASVSAGRTARFMAETEVLPRPTAAPLVPVAVGLTVAVWLEVQYGAVATMALLAAVVGSVLTAVIGATMLAALARAARGPAGGTRRPVVPGLFAGIGLAGAAVAFLVTTGLGFRVFSFVRPLPYPVNLAGPLVGVWAALGALRLVQLRRRGAAALGFRTTRPRAVPLEDPRPGRGE